MKYLVEFKSWYDKSAINEQESSYYVWGFKANDQGASSGDKVGFAALSAFYAYKKYVNKVKNKVKEFSFIFEI
jgi:hypothetical protein